MEAIFKRYFWVIRAFGLAVATGLAASAITTQIGTMLILDVKANDDVEDEESDEDEDEEDDKPTNPFANKPRSPFGKTSTLASSKNRTAEDIQNRNIFCPTCVPADPEAPPVPIPLGNGAAGIRPGEVPTKLPLKLIATYESSDPDSSLATIFDADLKGARLIGVDEELRPNVTLVGVDTGLVHLKNNAQQEYLQMGSEPPPTTKPGETPKPNDKPKPPSDREVPGAKEAINCPSDTLCIVDKKFVEKLMANPAMLAKQARIVPSQKNGETQGFKFYGIRRGSLPKLLGLKNGDMITEINGQELKSVDQAMALYTKLRRASNLSVGLVRKGKTINKEIQIQ